MARKKRVFFIKLVYIIIDILFFGISIFFAALFRRQTLPFSITFEKLFLDPDHLFHIIFIFWLLALLFFNNLHGLYQTRREVGESVAVWQVIKSVALSSIVAIVVIYVFRIPGFPRGVLVMTTLFLAVSLSIWRSIKKMFVEFLVVRGYNNFNVLIIGAGKIGMALSEEVKKHPGFGLNVLGFLDDFKFNNKEYQHLQILGKIADFKRIAKKEFINEIFITIHHDSRVFLGLLEQARNLGIAVRVIPQGFEFTTGEFLKYNIGFIPVLEYCDEEHLIKQAGKRLFDFISAGIAMVLLSPVFIVLGVMIKLDSPGSVFYLSRRYGRRGRKFHMYKFRSMAKNADKSLKEMRHKNEVDGPIFKMKNDPRVTRLGRMLRRYSLDELPQLINVLKGDMSLVGPRPFPLDQIEREDLLQLRRLEVRPGITGLWQIRGRSDVCFHRLVKWDIWYINNWSFWLDLNILVQTIPVVFKGKGAY